MGENVGRVAAHECLKGADKPEFLLEGKQHLQTSPTSLTAGALRPGRSGSCSSHRRGRASRCCRAASIFLLVPAAVRAFALLPLAALLVGHFTRFATTAAGISTSISASRPRRLAFLWTPFADFDGAFALSVLRLAWRRRFPPAAGFAACSR